MKDEATPEQIAMARRIVNANSNYMDGLDRGQCNFSAQEVMQIALAAIIETQRLDAAVAERVINKMRGSGESDLRTARHLVCAAIRAGQHYGKDTDQ
jgi:hypothetical protein